MNSPYVMSQHPQQAIYTIPYQQQVGVQYHVLSQTAQYQQNRMPGGAPGGGSQSQVMSQTAPPFTPGAQYGGGHPMYSQHHGPQSIIYSGGSGPPSLGMGIAPHNPQLSMYQGHRYPMGIPQPQQSMNLTQVPMSQGPPAGSMVPPQGAPPPHSQQQQQQPQQPQQTMYSQQPPRGPVVSLASSGPPPSTTPQPVTQSFHQAPPAPVSQPPPVSQPSNTLSRQRNRNPIKIIDPNTKQEVKVDNTISSKTTPAPGSDQSSTSSTPAPPETATTEREKSTDPKSREVATEFAAKVAALAEGSGSGSVKNEDSSSLSPATERNKDSSTSEIKIEDSTSASEDQSPADEIIPVVAVPVVQEAAAASTEKVSLTSNLVVTTDIKREDLSLYEPVSPTPLPDSPSDDTNKPVADAVKPSPFEEVINKKAGESDMKEEDYEPGKSRKKKPSTAAKKAALNSKGEKKGDLLDVFTGIVDPNAKPEEVNEDIAEVVDGIESVSISKPVETVSASEAVENDEIKEMKTDDASEAPKINGMVESLEVNSENDHDLEDGEILDEENDTADSKSVQLKYDYPQGQWSPLNPEGKKQYGREFLITLQRDPLSMQKPNNLPKMEIVKDQPNPRQPQNRIDFNPPYVKGSSSRQGGVSKRNSQGGEKQRGRDRVDGGNKRGMVISLPSISQEVKLNKAENAWMPSVKDKKKDADHKETEDEELRRKALAILNKLTPQKFETLVQRFQELPIDSHQKLALCMELVFEKAVDEPSFSVAYAMMCQELQKKKVPDENKPEENVNFRKLLISRCQKEFEKEYMDGREREKYIADMNEATNEDDKKKIKMEFEAMERKMRKRSLGNIRFIGELYKLGMLTARIMHECVRKLLSSNPSDEEALECLCRLLTTVGQDLEKETSDRLNKGPVQGLCDLASYFKDMRRFVEEKKTSARVRFLMQDVIELRQNGWKKRREDAGPKTIDQIHKEVEKEQMQMKIAHMTASLGPPQSNRRQDERRYDRTDDRRRSTKGPGPGQSGVSEDGWQAVPTRAAKVTTEKIDTNRIRNIGSSKVDADQMSFGPPKGGGGSFGAWGRGSQSGKNSRQEQHANQNRFSQLDQTEAGSTAYYDGRGSGGRFRQGNQQERQYGGRNSSAEAERARALQTARDMTNNNRSQSVIGPHPTLSRENSGGIGGQRSYSMVHTSNTYTEVSLNGSEITSDEDIQKWTKPLLEEFINNGDFEETIKEISEKFSCKTIEKFIENVFNEVIERSEKARVQAGNLMSELLLKKMISEEQWLVGLDSLLSVAEDLLVDIPKFWDFLAQIISPVLSSRAARLTILKESSVELMAGPLGKKCAAAKYVAAVLHEMSRSGQQHVLVLWRDSGLDWSDFISCDVSVDVSLTDNKLEWILQTTDLSDVTPHRLSMEIRRILDSNKNSNDSLFDWIDTHCSDKLEEATFIRDLTTAVVESCIDGIGGPFSQCKLNEGLLKTRDPILRKYLDGKVPLEGQALVALQYLMHKLEHPNKLLHTMFEKLYDDEIISEDAFFIWEKNDDPSEQEGKGVALKSCTQFLTWLREAENEEDCD